MKNSKWKIVRKDGKLSMLDGSATKETLEGMGYEVIEEGLERLKAIAVIDNYNKSVARKQKPVPRVYKRKKPLPKVEVEDDAEAEDDVEVEEDNPEVE